MLEEKFEVSASSSIDKIPNLTHDIDEKLFQRLEKFAKNTKSLIIVISISLVAFSSSYLISSISEFIQLNIIGKLEDKKKKK